MLIRVFGTMAIAKARELFAERLGGTPLVVPSSNRNHKNDELRPLIDRFYRGSSGDAPDRIKLIKLIWDAVETEFGARHEWYEINYSGNQEQMCLDTARLSSGRGIINDCEALVDRLISDYDLEGWADAVWTEVH